MVLLPELEAQEAAGPDIEALLQCVSEPLNVHDNEIQLTASLGVCFYPQSEEVDADQLLRQADQAMYQAKLAGKNRFHVFSPEEDQAMRGLHETMQRLRRALNEGELVLHYQPRVNMRSGKVLSAEALIRWQHPERGLLPPGQFLPLVEKQSLALEIGAWVIETALQQMMQWRRQGLDIAVSVNVFALQLQQPDFVHRLQESLARYPETQPSQLEIEVLETSALDDIEQISAVLKECQSLGVSCALDDFGTGYSTLSYLKRLPANVLKIDQSFVRDLLDDPEDLAILTGILSLATAFQRETVAEGVETEAHGAMLLDLGCEVGQGYGIARPMHARDLLPWVKRWRPARSWLHRRRRDASELRLLIAAVEHRAWVAAFRHHVEDGGPVPPLDVQSCAFGQWLQANADVFHDHADLLSRLKKQHQRVHEIAVEIRAQLEQADREGSRARLAFLYEQRDELLRLLDDCTEVFELDRDPVESGD